MICDKFIFCEYRTYGESIALFAEDDVPQPVILIHSKCSHKQQLNDGDPLNPADLFLLLVEDLILSLVDARLPLLYLADKALESQQPVVGLLQILDLQQVGRDLDLGVGIVSVSHCCVVFDELLDLSGTVSVEHDLDAESIKHIFISKGLLSVSWISLLNNPSVTLNACSLLVSVSIKRTR